MAERQELDEVVKLAKFPSNSHASKKKEVDETIHLKRITKGKVEKKSKSLGQRMKEEIVSEDSKSVADHLIWNILVPSIKDTLVDLVKNGIETLIYGGASSSNDRGSRYGGRSHVTTYDSYYNNRRTYNRAYSRRTSDLEDILFESNAEAEKVLLTMCDMLDEYDFVTRGNFYELVGESTAPSDFRWGWDNLRSARVERVRNGYIIKMPREVAID